MVIDEAGSVDRMGRRGAGILTAALVMATACAGPSSDPSRATDSPPAARPSEEATGPELYNQDWNLLKMALAHGVMVIEIEAADPARALELARELREPLGEEYGEVLVYVQQMGTDDAPPVRRVRWTKQGGYEELVY